MKTIILSVFVIGIFACQSAKKTSECHYVKTCQDDYVLYCPDTSIYPKTYQDSVNWGILPDTNTYKVWGDTLLKFEDYLIEKQKLNQQLDSLFKTW